MGIVIISEAKIPASYNEEEKSCFLGIKELGKILGAKALIIEEEESKAVLLEFEEEVSSHVIEAITKFNEDDHPLLITFVYENEGTEGTRYGI